MLLRDMKSHAIDLGQFARQDREAFRITSLIYETPLNYDYWLATYDAHHQEWGHLRFTLIIPKKIAPSIELAQALVREPVLDEVKAALATATEEGRPMSVTASEDGWSLV